MTQLILNIEDEKKAFKLIEFLRTLNYINVEKISEDNAPVLDSEKALKQSRLESAKEEDFKSWDDIKDKFKNNSRLA